MAIQSTKRIELVFMADQPSPWTFWIESTSRLARRTEFNSQLSTRVLGGAAAVLLFMLYLFPAATVMLILVSLMGIFPMTLVGMAGYSRGR